MRRRAVLKSLAACAAATAGRPLRALDTQPTPQIACNQVGFLPHAAKLASISGATGDTFTLLSPGNAPVLTAPLSAPMQDAASGDTVRIADLSRITAPGLYRLRAGSATSDAFRIAPGIYAETLRTAMRGYTGQRCRCAVNLGGGYQHPPCHMTSSWHPSSGRSGPFNNHGGWHDAGDYGRYIVNSGITTGTLLWAWELYQPALAPLHLDVPESNGPLPDCLAEIRWNLDWMLTLQDTDGGVWQKETSENFCGFVMPQNDPLPIYIIGTGAAPYKSTCATADLASVAAIAARVYQPCDRAYAARCLAAARSAYAWAVAHPNVPFTNPPGITTGNYGDADASDELLWAAAELWRTTGEPQYETAFLAGFQAIRQANGAVPITAPSWSNVLSMACWAYALAPRKADAAALDHIRQQTAGAAAFHVQQAAQNGYGNTLALTDYTWGSNGAAANQSLLLLIADHLSPSAPFFNAALANLDYLLGRNCFAVSWLTQVGTRPFQHPHHRPSIADGLAAPWPGLLSGGPNAHPADPTAAKLPPGPPMRMWIDHDLAYSVNEIAINWNAPLVFLLAAACS